MRGHCGIREAPAFAEHQCRHQGSNTGVDVHNGAAGVIFETELLKPTATPDPVGDRGVHQCDPKNREPEHGGELHTLSEATDDEGRCNDGECELKHGENRFRNGPIECVSPDTGHENLSKAHPLIGTAAIAEGEAICVDQPQYRNQTRDRETLHQDRQDVPGTYQARVKQ